MLFEDTCCLDPGIVAAHVFMLVVHVDVQHVGCCTSVGFHFTFPTYLMLRSSDSWLHHLTTLHSTQKASNTDSLRELNTVIACCCAMLYRSIAMVWITEGNRWPQLLRLKLSFYAIPKCAVNFIELQLILSSGF